MSAAETWMSLAEAHRLLISEAGAVPRLVERAERRLSAKIISGEIKARSLRAFVGNSYDVDPIRMELPVETIFKEHLHLTSQMDADSRKAFGVPDFVWSESRVLLDRRFARAGRSAPAVWQPQQELFCIELCRDEFDLTSILDRAN